MDNIITGYNKGANITIMNTINHPGHFDENNKWIGSKLDLIYKDCDTGKKGVEQIDTPMYEYYLLNDEAYHVDYNRDFIEKENVHPVICEHQKLKYDIAEKTGNLEWFKQNKATGNGRLNNRIHYHPDVFMSDMNISDHYRFQFNTNYKNEVCPITKMYFDIECDTINIKGDFPELGEAPVNAISCIMNHTVYVFIPRDYTIPGMVAFEKEVNEHKAELEAEFVKFIQDYVGGNRPKVYQKRLKALDMEELHIKFAFYDSEIQCIAAFFAMVNKLQPDFVLAWNMGFDTPTLIERIRQCGYKPEDICCHPDFKKNRVAEYVIKYSDIAPDDYAERGDYCNISGYSNWMCQLIQFASKRKGQHAIENYKIDYIGQLICGVPKLDYSHICDSIKDLPRADFRTFILYNIVDTIVQKCIEERVNDIDFVFANTIAFNTRYSKVHRQTVFLTNKRIKEFMASGFVPGNNVNKENEKKDYPGGFVADLELISHYPMDKINGVPVRLFKNLVDFDYKSLYPSIWRQWNMCKNGMIGQMNLLEPSRCGNKFGVKCYDTNIAFAQDIHAANWIEFGWRWFDLPDFEEMVSDCEEYFKNHRTQGYMALNPDNGAIKLFRPRDTINKPIKPCRHWQANEFADYKISDAKCIKPYSLDVPMDKLYDTYSVKFFEERSDVVAMAEQ